MKKIIVFLLALTLCAGLCACGAASEEAQAAARAEEEAAAAEAAFQEAMGVLRASVDPEAVTGDKAVAIVFEGRKDRVGAYSTAYVPEALRTEDPAAVRYLIRCIREKTDFGIYDNGKAALRWEYTVEVVDLKQDQLLNSNVFLGAEPPKVLQEGKNSNIGTAPAMDPILSWIEEQIARGTPVDCLKTWVDVYVQVPEGWGEVYLGYLDDYYPEGEGVSYCRKMEKAGQWYVLTVPGWARKIYVSSDPRLVGEEGYHSTEASSKDKFRNPEAEGKDLWIRVLDLEKNAEYFREEPVQ